MDTIGQRIQRAMDAEHWEAKDGERRWTRGHLAELVGAHPDTVRKWCEDESVPPADKLDLIGELLNVRTDWLISGQHDELRWRWADVYIERPLHLIDGPMYVEGQPYWTPPPSRQSERHTYREFWCGFHSVRSKTVRPDRAEWWYEAISPTVTELFKNYLARVFFHRTFPSAEARGKFAAQRLMECVEEAYKLDESKRRLTKNYVSAAWTDYLVRLLARGLATVRTELGGA